jgi:hypothetical protein
MLRKRAKGGRVDGGLGVTEAVRRNLCECEGNGEMHNGQYEPAMPTGAHMRHVANGTHDGPHAPWGVKGTIWPHVARESHEGLYGQCSPCCLREHIWARVARGIHADLKRARVLHETFDGPYGPT